MRKKLFSFFLFLVVLVVALSVVKADSAFDYSIRKLGSYYQILDSGSNVIESSTSSSTAFNWLLGSGGYAINGVTVFVESGAYTVDSTWNIYVSGVTLTFESGAILTSVAHGSNYGSQSCVMMWIYGNNVVVSGITMNGNGLNQWVNSVQQISASTLVTDGNYNSAMYIQGGNCLIEDATIYNCRCFGIVMVLGSNNSGVINSKIYNCGTNGLTAGMGDVNPNTGRTFNCFFVNNEVYGCSDVGIDSYFDSKDTIITGNYVHDISPSACPMSGYANSYWGIGGEWGSGIGNNNYSLIANNTIIDVQNYGVFICNSVGSGSCDYNLVSGNTIKGCWHGVRISDCSSASYNIIEFNSLINCGGEGISLDSTAHYTNVYGNNYTNCATNFSDGGTNTSTSAPTIVALTVTSSPVEVGYVTANSVTPFYLPYTFYATVGNSKELVASNLFGYTFLNWSDGGAQSHVITVPSTDTVFIVTYIARGGSSSSPLPSNSPSVSPVPSSTPDATLIFGVLFILVAVSLLLSLLPSGKRR